MKTFVTLLVILLLATPALAAEVDGTWSGSVTTGNGELPISFSFKAEGDVLKGSMTGPDGTPFQITNGKISRYQCVVPSTWNCSPRDAQGVPGAYESALMENHPLLDPKRPIEILRTVHSFDPCMSCGVHVLDATGTEVTEVRVQ